MTTIQLQFRRDLEEGKQANLRKPQRKNNKVFPSIGGIFVQESPALLNEGKNITTIGKSRK